MLVTPPFWASSKIALMRASNKPPVELVVDDLGEETYMEIDFIFLKKENAKSNSSL